MSHNASGKFPAYITNHTPTAFDTAGVLVYTITGDNNLSPDSTLDIPASVGSVVGTPVFTRTSTTISTLAFTINVLSPPSTAVGHTLVLSAAGVASVGQSLDITHGGWTPAVLVTGSNDGFWNAAALVASLSDGDRVASWSPSAGTLQPLANSTVNDRPLFRDGSPLGINGFPAVQFKYPLKELYFDPTEFEGKTAFTVAILHQNPNMTRYGQTTHLYLDTVGGQKLLLHGGTSSTPMRWNLYDSAGGLGYYSTGIDSTVIQHIWTSDDNGTQQIFDGTVLRKTATGTAHTATNTPKIWSSPPGTNAGDDGWFISEIVYVERVLSSTERTELTDYWTAKYGS